MKIRFAVLLLALLLIFCSCSPAEADVSLPAESAPDNSEALSTAESAGESSAVIRLTASPSRVTISLGADYNLLDGVSCTDGSGNDLTDKIQVSDGGFDSDKPGDYMITYSYSDENGGSASASRSVTVKDNAVFAAPPIYDGVISGEIKNPEAPAVYGGAWYRKSVSSEDYWVGIEGTVTLPEVSIRRYLSSYDQSLDIDYTVKNLDNPSVYLGGNAGAESDVGLSLSKALVGGSISVGSAVFRPFWRYITKTGKDEGGYNVHDGKYSVSANGNNCFANYHWSYTEYYYLPGDTLRIIVYSPEKDKLQLQIEVIEKSSLPASVELRKKNGWKDPENFKSPLFTSIGYGSEKCEFKRVNAIDQSANEGGVAIPTSTKISNAIWHSTYLYRVIDGTLCRVPMDDSRRGVTSAPTGDAFEVSYESVDRNIGGEVITICPENAGK